MVQTLVALGQITGCFIADHHSIATWLKRSLPASPNGAALPSLWLTLYGHFGFVCTLKENQAEVEPAYLTRMQRRIDFGGSAQHHHFPSNYVSTTRYKIWTIVPLNLFEQFHRFANIWFLIVSILQMLPFKISPTTSWATLVPLVGVLFVTFCKDAYEDLKRWRDDCRVNNQACKMSKTPEDSSFKAVRWSDVQVGWLLKLHRDQPVPADLLPLGLRWASGMAGMSFVLKVLVSEAQIYVTTFEMGFTLSIQNKLVILQKPMLMILTWTG